MGLDEAAPGLLGDAELPDLGLEPLYPRLHPAIFSLQPVLDGSSLLELEDELIVFCQRFLDLSVEDPLSLLSP